MKQCPRCASELGLNDKVCPRCGLPVAEKSLEETAEQMENDAKSKQLNRAQKKEKLRLAKKAKKEAKKQKKLAESLVKTDFRKYATNAESRVYVNKKDKNSQMQFEVDSNGEINIDTTDVEIIGEKAGKMFEEKQMQTYSLKKARGDYRPPKIKWWEIYKFADRSFARRKIKKEVSKASRVRPDFISKTKLLLFAIFFGWFGLHNFYAKNKKRGFVSLICILISIFGMVFDNIAFLKKFELWIVGFPGFIVLMIWFSDIINIMFNKFAYSVQKDAFISGMNIETRAKLGEKYIDLELLHKPWPVRFKVWCQKQKKNYQEWKHDRRQALIEKEKAKLERQEEKDKINSEIAEFEAKENKELFEKNNEGKEQKIKEVEPAQDVTQTTKKVGGPKRARISLKVKTSKKAKSSKNYKNKKK